MKLNKLLEAITIEKSYNNSDLEINHIVCNSKKATEGDLFVCIKGYKTDGHIYINSALENGAVALIVEDYQPEIKVPQYVVKNSRKALAALADMFYDHPSKDMKVLGVTATNGKTTTTFMLNHILERHGLNTGLIGTVMVKYGDYSKASYLTTPESIDLQSIFNEMRKVEVSHACMEVSSSAIELSRVGNVDFDILALNNISPEHTDLHGSFERYYAIKSSIIKEAKPHQRVILNLDDSYVAPIVNQTSGEVFTYGIDNKTGDFLAKDVDISTGRGSFTFEILKPFEVNGKIIDKCSFPVRLKTPGYHTIYNAMVAIIMSLMCEVPIKTIQEGLADFAGVERRFEIVYEDDFVIIDDHFANSGNITATFKTLDKMTFKDLKIVYALRGSRGVSVIREAAETTVEWAKKLGVEEVIVSLSESHITWKDEVVQEEIDVYNHIMKDAGIRVHMHKELGDAIEEGLKKVRNEDVLLLAGCQGMDYGVKVALEQIHKNRPELDKDKLFEPLKKRVAGVEDLEGKNE